MFFSSAENCFFFRYQYLSIWRFQSWCREEFWTIHCFKSITETLALVSVGVLLKVLWLFTPPVILNYPQMCLSCVVKVWKMLPLVVWLTDVSIFFHVRQSWHLRAVIALESGVRSVVTCWTIDKEVVGSNPTNGRNKLSVVHGSLGLLSPFGKMSTGFQWPGSST